MISDIDCVFPGEFLCMFVLHLPKCKSIGPSKSLVIDDPRLDQAQQRCKPDSRNAWPNHAFGGVL